MSTEMTETRVDGYEHAGGDHCGSASLANLAAHYGWAYDEPTCLGLGSGLGFTYFEPGESPWRVFFGRPMWVEQAFFEHLGIGFEHRRGEDFERTWSRMRDHIDAGRPVMVYTDIAHLPYFGTDTHFSPHTLLVVGYRTADGSGHYRGPASGGSSGDPTRGPAGAVEVLLSDSEFGGLQSVGLGDLRAAMTTDHVYPLSAESFAVTDPTPTRSFAAAARDAVAETATYMLDPPSASRSLGDPPVDEGAHGVEGIRAFARELPAFTTLPDPSWAVRFAYQTVERRGTGGGAFRRLYADFLETAAREIETLPADAADRMGAVAADWTAVGDWLKTASERDSTDAMATDLESIAEDVHAIADREAAIYRDLLAATD